MPHIREATPADAVWFVANVRALAAEPDTQMPLTPEEYVTTPEQQAGVISGAAARGDLYIIAEVDGERVGELNLRRGTRLALRHSAVLGLSVVPAWRNRRIGSALIQHALAWARGPGALRRIELYVYTTNAPAIRLYQNHGFILEGRRKNAIRTADGFIDDFLMACDPAL